MWIIKKCQKLREFLIFPIELGNLYQNNEYRINCPNPNVNFCLLTKIGLVYGRVPVCAGAEAASKFLPGAASK
jgi:hypothetical protein